MASILEIHYSHPTLGSGVIEVNPEDSLDMDSLDKGGFDYPLKGLIFPLSHKQLPCKYFFPYTPLQHFYKSVKGEPYKTK
jgi:hypothetical protein